MMITGVKRLLYHGCCLGIVSGACSPTREQQGCSSEVGEAESTLVCSFTGKYVYCSPIIFDGLGWRTCSMCE